MPKDRLTRQTDRTTFQLRCPNKRCSECQQDVRKIERQADRQKDRQTERLLSLVNKTKFVEHVKTSEAEILPFLVHCQWTMVDATSGGGGGGGGVSILS